MKVENIWPSGSVLLYWLAVDSYHEKEGGSKCVVKKRCTLLPFIALSAAQSSAQTHIHSAILVIDTLNIVSYKQVHWLVGTPYSSIKTSNEYEMLVEKDTKNKSMVTSVGGAEIAGADPGFP